MLLEGLAPELATGLLKVTRPVPKQFWFYLCEGVF